MIPYGRQSISENDINAVVDVLRSPFLTQGPVVPAFERAFAETVDSEYAVAVNSATSALHLACLALGLGSGDSLWTTPITFVASANCARYCGADVDFVDIDPATGLMDPAVLEAKLQEAAGRGVLPKIVVPVHLSGTSCDMQAIGALAERYGFHVLEDASHAVGGNFQDVPIGACTHSSITVFSFHPVKIITTAEGGIATTNDASLAKKMTLLRSHGIEREQSLFEHPSPGAWSYEQQRLGFNYRMTELQAALGLSQLDRLEAIVEERNRLLRQYRQLLTGLPVKLLDVPDGVQSAVHLAVIRLVSATSSQHRAVFDSLRASGIGVQLHYMPVHLHPYYRRLGFCEGQCPVSEAYARSALSLPLFPGLTDQDQERIVSQLRAALLHAEVIAL